MNWLPIESAPKDGTKILVLCDGKVLMTRCDPHTPESLAEFNSLRATEMARAEAKRRQTHPQTDLPLEAA